MIREMRKTYDSEASTAHTAQLMDLSREDVTGWVWAANTAEWQSKAILTTACTNSKSF